MVTRIRTPTNGEDVVGSAQNDLLAWDTTEEDFLVVPPSTIGLGAFDFVVTSQAQLQAIAGAPVAGAFQLPPGSYAFKGFALTGAGLRIIAGRSVLIFGMGLAKTITTDAAIGLEVEAGALCELYSLTLSATAAAAIGLQNAGTLKTFSASVVASGAGSRALVQSAGTARLISTPLSAVDTAIDQSGGDITGSACDLTTTNGAEDGVTPTGGTLKLFGGTWTMAGEGLVNNGGSVTLVGCALATGSRAVEMTSGPVTLFDVDITAAALFAVRNASSSPLVAVGGTWTATASIGCVTTGAGSTTLDGVALTGGVQAAQFGGTGITIARDCIYSAPLENVLQVNTGVAGSCQVNGGSVTKTAGAAGAIVLIGSTAGTAREIALKNLNLAGNDAADIGVSINKSVETLHLNVHCTTVVDTAIVYVGGTLQQATCRDVSCLPNGAGTGIDWAAASVPVNALIESGCTLPVNTPFANHAHNTARVNRRQCTGVAALLTETAIV